MNKKAFNSEFFFYVLMLLIWTRETVFFLFEQAFRYLPFVGRFYMQLFPAVVLILLVLSFRYIVTFIKGQDLIFYLAILTVLIASALALPDNSSYIFKYFIEITVSTVPMYFIGLAYSHNNIKNKLYIASILGIIVTFSYSIYTLVTGKLFVTDNMDAAYKILPSVLFLIYIAFLNNKPVNWVAVVFGVFCIITYGNRGSLLAILIYVLLSVFFYVVISKSFVKKIIFLIASVLSVVLLTSKNIIVKIAGWLSEIFRKFGFSTRIFNELLQGTISISNGRSVLSENTLEAIAAKPLTGYGLMGGFIVNDIYSHNIFLDFVCEYGIIVGTAICFIAVFIPVRALTIVRKNNYFFFLLMIFVMVYVKLFLSSYYLTEPYLFFLLGISVSCIRNKAIVYEKAN